MSDYHAEQSPDQLTSLFGDIARTLSGSFESLYYVSLADDSYYEFHSSGKYAQLHLTLTGTAFFDECQNNIPSVICPDDMAMVSRFTQKSHIVPLLRQGSRPVLTYRIMINGEPRFYRMRCMLAASGESHMIVAVENVDESMRIEQERYAVIRSLGGSYSCVFTVDTGTDRVTDYIDNGLGEFPPEQTAPFYADHTMAGRLHILAYEMVCQSDRQQFIEATRRETILAALDSESIYQVYYRVILGSEYHFYKLKFTRQAPSSCITVGIRNRDMDELDELRRKQQLMDAKSHTEKLVEEQTEELRRKNISLRKMNEGVVELLGSVVESRDKDSGEHIRRVKGFTYILAQQVMHDLPEYGLTNRQIGLIVYASALHDVGKIAIPDHILLKPGPLNESEFEIMKTHCQRGCDILRSMSSYWNRDYLDIDMDICLYHHEKWDGSGYPRGLKGDEIPLSAQIVSIADIYDALTTIRCYKGAYTYDDAFNMIMSGRCGAFSPKLLGCFEKCRIFFEKHAMDTTSIVHVDVPLEDIFPAYMIKSAVSASVHTHLPGAAAAHSPAGNGCFAGMRFLLADDSQLALAVSRETLEAEGAVTECVSSGTDALQRYSVSGNRFDAVLLDFNMPGMGCISTVRHMHAAISDSPHKIPIIVLTEDGEDKEITELFHAGADACLAKPLRSEELGRILLPCLHQNGRFTEELLSDTLRLAQTDALTQVRSVIAYTDALKTLATRLSAGDTPHFAAVMCDINGLKKENDTFGHDNGDRYILNACRILCHVFQNSQVYRIGGDEFVAILQGEDLERAPELISKLKKQRQEARAISDASGGKTDFAFGIAFFNPDTDMYITDTIHRADKEMYRDKRTLA